MRRGARGFPAWPGLGVAGAGALVALAACGSVTGHPAAGGSPAVPGTVPAVPAAILRAVTHGTSGRIAVVPSPGAVLAHPAQSRAAALRTALRQEPPGTKILGLTLARVRGFGFGTDMTRSQLAWLVSVDPTAGPTARAVRPAGGTTSTSRPSTRVRAGG
ncbi:MAG TPA: hypothetical protein VGD68_15190 [Streptosporangiaceae bacterium]